MVDAWDQFWDSAPGSEIELEALITYEFLEALQSFEELDAALATLDDVLE